jgi:hypothetical protein
MHATTSAVAARFEALHRRLALVSERNLEDRNLPERGPADQGAVA